MKLPSNSNRHTIDLIDRRLKFVHDSIQMACEEGRSEIILYGLKVGRFERERLRDLGFNVLDMHAGAGRRSVKIQWGTT